MSADEIVGQIMAAHQESISAQDAMRDAAQRRAELIRQAAREDVSMQSIADALGTTRQRVYQMGKSSP